MDGCRSNWVILLPCFDGNEVIAGASRVVGVLVVASEAVDACAPVDTGQVVDAIGKGQELVLVVRCAVVVTVGASAHCHSECTWACRRAGPGRSILEELAVPVIIAGQDSRHIVAANEDRLHSSIDSAAGQY